MTSNYIHKTAHDSYVYRRRVPIKLVPYLNKTNVKLSIGQDIALANERANRINLTFDESLALLPVNLPNEIKNNLIASKFNPFGISGTTLEKMASPSQWHEVTQQYVNTLNVSSDELRDQKYFLFTLLPAIFTALIKQDNPAVESLTHSTLISIRELLVQLPKRNIQRYRDMPVDVLVMHVKQ